MLIVVDKGRFHERVEEAGDFFYSKLNEGSDRGALEDVEKVCMQLADALGRLLGLMVDKQLVSLEEAAKMVGAYGTIELHKL